MSSVQSSHQCWVCKHHLTVCSVRSREAGNGPSRRHSLRPMLHEQYPEAAGSKHGVFMVHCASLDCSQLRRVSTGHLLGGRLAALDEAVERVLDAEPVLRVGGRLEHVGRQPQQRQPLAVRRVAEQLLKRLQAVQMLYSFIKSMLEAI